MQAMLQRLPVPALMRPRSQQMLRTALCRTAASSSDSRPPAALEAFGLSVLHHDGSPGEFFPRWVRELPFRVHMPLVDDPNGPVKATLLAAPELCHGLGVTGCALSALQPILPASMPILLASMRGHIGCSRQPSALVEWML